MIYKSNKSPPPSKLRRIVRQVINLAHKTQSYTYRNHWDWCTQKSLHRSAPWPWSSRAVHLRCPQKPNTLPSVWPGAWEDSLLKADESQAWWRTSVCSSCYSGGYGRKTRQHSKTWPEGESKLKQGSNLCQLWGAWYQCPRTHACIHMCACTQTHTHSLLEKGRFLGLMQLKNTWQILTWVLATEPHTIEDTHFQSHSTKLLKLQEVSKKKV